MKIETQQFCKASCGQGYDYYGTQVKDSTLDTPCANLPRNFEFSVAALVCRVTATEEPPESRGRLHNSHR